MCEKDTIPVDNFRTVVGENPDCLLLSGTVVGEHPDHVCWVWHGGSAKSYYKVTMSFTHESQGGNPIGKALVLSNLEIQIII